MTFAVRKLGLFLLPFAAAACAKTATNTATPVENAPAAKAAGLDTSLDPSLTVATVNGSPITGAELDAVAKDEIKKATSEYVEKVHTTRKEALEELIARRIVEIEAKARDMTPEALIALEVEAKIPPPTEAQLQDVYDRFVKGRADVTFEQAKPRLTQQMHQQEAQMRSRAFFDELRAKYKVTTHLPLPEVERVKVAAEGPARGPANAKISVVIFSDFECPFCSRAVAPIDEVVKTYGDKVRVVFRHYPLPFHAKAQKAAEASLCAHDQGKFWEMHDAMFADQAKLEVADLKATARTIGLDGAKFDACLDSGEKAATVKKDAEAGQVAGVNGTPAFFINGRSLSGAQPFESFKEIIDAELTN